MQEIKILDHGSIRFVEDWGRGDAGVAEAGIIEAARQSTQGNFRGWAPYELCERCDGWRVHTPVEGVAGVIGHALTLCYLKPDCEHQWKKFPRGDEGLLSFLFSSKPQHATPFEFAGLVIEVKAPIFVFREWHRHRTQSYNEMSARYAPLPCEDYLPTVERCLEGAALARATKNRQAHAAADSIELDGHTAMRWLNELEQLYGRVDGHYREGLRIGIPKELARCAMVVSRFTQMRAHTNLRNWLAFMTLRSDKGAQWEIRQYAEALGTIIRDRFPRTWTLFELGRAA